MNIKNNFYKIKKNILMYLQVQITLKSNYYYTLKYYFYY
jgi:hypothetical protein